MSKIQPIAGSADRIHLASVVPLPSPFTLNIFPTNSCNFRCNYCGQSLGMAALKKKYPHIGSSNMTLSTLDNVVTHSKEFKRPYKLVSFMGHGEPLVHALLPEMISKVRDAGIAERIEIITNASLLTQELSRKLVDAGADNLRISLQGLSADKYEKICGVTIDFEAFIKNVAYYHSYGNQRGAKVFVKIVDAALEEGEEELFYKMFDSISDRMYIERIQPVYEGISYEKLKGNLTDRYGNEHKPRKVCPLPFYMLNIWPDGSVAPCDAIYRPVVLGNCNNDSLTALWNGEKLREFQMQLLSNGRESVEKCRPCCAPDDVSHPADVLDEGAEDILTKLRNCSLQ